MRFLADESCDHGIVKALRAAGHDVVAVQDQSLGANDSVVMEIARRDSRVLLTEDKDFGQLAYADHARHTGVILFRIPYSARAWMLNEIPAIVIRLEQRLLGKFVVVQPGRIRISEYP